MADRTAASVPDEQTTKPAQDAPQTSAGTAQQSNELPNVPVTPPELPQETATVLDSRLAYEGKIFSVYTEHVREPGGVEAVRDVVRHNGSVVVLAVDSSTNPADPLVVVERQFRHAANGYLLELPAGRVEPGENVRDAAERELIEETGYRATEWTRLVRYYASPGFVGEWMEIYLATGIVAGEATPEDDERIEVRLMPLSDLVRMAAAGEIHDGKTIVGAMIYAQRLRDAAGAR